MSRQYLYSEYEQLYDDFQNRFNGNFIEFIEYFNIEPEYGIFILTMSEIMSECQDYANFVS